MKKQSQFMRLFLVFILFFGLVTPSVQAVTSDTENVQSTETVTTPTVDSEATPNKPEETAPDNQEETEVPQEVEPPFTAVDDATTARQVVMRVLSTTDLHTNLVNYDYYQDKPSQALGLAKTAVLIEEAKQQNGNVVLVDNGDTIQGTPLGTYFATVNPVKDGQVHPMYDALQRLGFDAATLGNHEFNYGLPYLDTVLANVTMPIVNANVMRADNGQHRFTPFVVTDKEFVTTDGEKVTVKVGITGIVPPQILTWDRAHLLGEVTVKDSVEAVRDIIPAMQREGAEVIIVLSHSGIGNAQYVPNEENIGYQLSEIEGVDAVVTGHSHAEFPTNTGRGAYERLPNVDLVKGTINGTPVTMAGKYGDHLGVIELTLTETDGGWHVTDGRAEIRPIDKNSDVAHAGVVQAANAAHEATIAYVRQEVGETTAPINSYFALVKDDPSVQIVNNAQMWYVKPLLAGTPEADLPLLSAAAPFKAGTRNDPTAYTDIKQGPIAIKNVADLYLYDNVTAVLKVNGAQLREWLEMSAGQFNTIDPNKPEPQNLINPNFRTYNFDVIDGVTYEFDLTEPNKYDTSGTLVNPQANRVKNLRYRGQLVTDDQQFMVATNNYRAFGPFPGVRDAEKKEVLNLENRQAIINYILEVKTIDPTADDNWRFADTTGVAEIRFETADSAKDLIADSKDVAYLNGVAGGFGNYRLVRQNAGQPVKNGWKWETDSWYHYTNGAKDTGWVRVDNDYFYLKADGKLATGWQWIGDAWYFLKDGGQMAKSWYKVDGVWYLFADGGQMLTGWQRVNGKWYRLAEGGQLLTGWTQYNNNWYYLLDNGAMATSQWVNPWGNNWYYVNANGEVLTGRQYLGTQWYQFDANGLWLR